MRFCIALDIDGVTANFIDACERFMEEVHGLPRLGVHVEYNSIKFGIDAGPEELVVRETAYREFFQEVNFDRWLAMCPIEGAVDAIRRLSVGHDITFVTWRRESLIPVTRAWTVKHDIGLPVVHTHDKHLIDADLFIDDNVQVVSELLDYGRYAFLFRQPWNKDSDLPSLDGWDAVVELVGAMEAERA